MLSEISTRSNIIEVSRELFSELGYAGTSIRAIAGKADANIASINYHFGSKHDLFWYLVLDAHRLIEKGVAECIDQNNDHQEILLAVFRFFRSHKGLVRSTIKALMNEGVPPASKGHIYNEVMADSMMGPPGTVSLINYFVEEMKMDRQHVVWVVKSIFSLVVHWTLVSTCSTINKLIDMDPSWEFQELEANLLSAAKAMLQSPNLN